MLRRARAGVRNRVRVYWGGEGEREPAEVLGYALGGPLRQRAGLGHRQILEVMGFRWDRDLRSLPTFQLGFLAIFELMATVFGCRYSSY